MKINEMLNGKDMTVCLIVGLIKKTLFKMSQYFPKQFKNIGGNINAKVDLSNYVIKTDLKNIDLSYLIGKHYFDQDGSQNYLVF